VAAATRHAEASSEGAMIDRTSLRLSATLLLVGQLLYT
jgi:hypothetical protein